MGAVNTMPMLPLAKTPAEMEAEKKAVRKQKNRASAAATRQRREEYTASLESQVWIQLGCVGSAVWCRVQQQLLSSWIWEGTLLGLMCA